MRMERAALRRDIQERSIASTGFGTVDLNSDGHAQAAPTRATGAIK